MTELNFEKIRENLIDVYSAYISDTLNNIQKNLAHSLYSNYSFAYDVLPDDLSVGIMNVIDIAHDTGVHLSKDKAKEILKKLKMNSK
jgi:hypothetical protein